jgi:hypothetical protein
MHLDSSSQHIIQVSRISYSLISHFESIFLIVFIGINVGKQYINGNG